MFNNDSKEQYIYFTRTSNFKTNYIICILDILLIIFIV